MRSRTSYFNRTLFLKTVTRFWPLWFIYFAVWFVAMPLVLTANLAPTTYGWTGRSAVLIMQQNVCSGAVYYGVIIGLIAACVAAMAVWSFMYSARSASGTASLPLRRECVFASVSLGGLAPLLAVHVVIALLCLAIQGYYGVFDPAIMGQWLAAVTLELVFFYGFALACAQLTGNLAVLPLVYLVLNFTVYFVERLFENLMTYFVYGAWRTHTYRLTALSPALGMIRYFNFENEKVYLAEEARYDTVAYHLTGWGALFAYAAVGLAFAALALWLYRRRRMESAGDVVAVNILKPVFKYCMTFGCALCVGALLYEYLGRNGDYTQWTSAARMTLFMLVGAFLGYFASEMLIHKSFRVWRGRWLGLGVSALVVVALMLSLELDLYGYERRVPEPGRVESVFISGDGYDATFYDPENIAAVTQLHRSVVEKKQYYESFDSRRGYADTNSDYGPNPRSMSLYIDYEMANGSHITRRYYGLGYYLGDPSTQTDARAAQTLLNTTEAIAWRKTTAIEYNAETIFDARAECSLLSWDVEKAMETTALVYDGYGDRIAEKYGYGAQFSDAEISQLFGDMSEYSAEWYFKPEEAAELYERCILPDMADGTIGTVWLIADEEYLNTVYDARISIDARVPRNTNTRLNSGYYEATATNTVGHTVSRDTSYDYDYFYTVPTVNSVRTNRWLEEHGVILRTLSETGHN